MSLDLYIKSEKTFNKSSTGVYVRENGRNVELKTMDESIFQKLMTLKYKNTCTKRMSCGTKTSHTISGQWLAMFLLGNWPCMTICGDLKNMVLGLYQKNIEKE